MKGSIMPAIAKRQNLVYTPSVPDEEAQINHVFEGSFPASDAPPWTLGVSHPSVSDVVDVSRPPSRERVRKILLEWLGVVA